LLVYRCWDYETECCRAATSVLVRVRPRGTLSKNCAAFVCVCVRPSVDVAVIVHQQSTDACLSANFCSAYLLGNPSHHELYDKSPEPYATLTTPPSPISMLVVKVTQGIAHLTSTSEGLHSKYTPPSGLAYQHSCLSSSRIQLDSDSRLQSRC